MSSRPTAYAILGYDKDTDSYTRLAYWYGDVEIAKSVAKYLTTLSLNKTNGELFDLIEVRKPFDWVEVGEEYSGVKHCVYPCV